MKFKRMIYMKRENREGNSLNILVFNCGSSSLKFRLIAMPDELELAGGEAQRIGSKTSEKPRIVSRINGKETVIDADIKNHEEAFKKVIELLSAEKGFKIDALGHRLVHDGGIFRGNILINRGNIRKLKKTESFAPLHNPRAIAIIEECFRLYPDIKQTAVFDTAFHKTIPWYAKKYALPEEITRSLKIRKYGFHGSSHKFVMTEAAGLMGIPPEKFNAVICHLGSGGASICAVKGGRSIDNTMGYSPLPGLVMSTRGGDIDPGVALCLALQSGKEFDGLEKILNNNSGVLALSGFSGDIRDIINEMKKDGSGGDRGRMDLTYRIYTWRIKRALGSYLAVTGRTDAVIFTDTIGELVPEVREAVCSGMEDFGIKLNYEVNLAVKRLPAVISTDESRVCVMAIATNEELEIARESLKVLNQIH
jgi:acetate kinase